MAITRDQLRSLYLAEFTGGVEMLVNTQWLNIVLFTVLLVAGLATVYLMVRRVLTSPAEGEEAA
jgi:hypothetical protein